MKFYLENFYISWKCKNKDEFWTFKEIQSMLPKFLKLYITLLVSQAQFFKLT